MSLNAGRLLGISAVLLASAEGALRRNAPAASPPVAFPFRAPKGAWVGERTGTSDHHCFRFVYAVVKDFPLEDHKGASFADNLVSLCRSSDTTECRKLALSLQDIVAAKKEHRALKTKQSYETWCSKFATDEPARPSPKAEKVKHQAVTATAQPAASKLSKEAPARPTTSHKAATPKAVAPGTPPTAAATATPAGPRSKPVAVAHPAPAHHPAAAAATPVTLVKQARGAATAADPSIAAEAAMAAGIQADKAAAQAELKRRAAVDPEHCACVHRDGQEICKCRDEEEEHEKPQTPKGGSSSQILGFAIASSAASGGDVVSGLDSLTSALAAARASADTLRKKHAHA